MYNITDYSKERAKELNVKIEIAKNKKYKLDVFNCNGDYITSIGSSNYMDYPTYIRYHGLRYADKRRHFYKLRHNKDRHITWSRGFFADRILW